MMFGSSHNNNSHRSKQAKPSLFPVLSLAIITLMSIVLIITLVYSIHDPTEEARRKK
jgi:hypothetical protein